MISSWRYHDILVVSNLFFMENFDQVPISSETKKERDQTIPLVDEELRLITSQLEMVDDRIADIDPRIHRGGPYAVTREANLTPEGVNTIEEDTFDLKAVREDLYRELEEYYSTRTNQLEREVKQEVESALRKVLPDALKGGGRELFILGNNGDIHPQILRGLGRDVLPKLSRKKLEIMRKLYDPNMSEGEFVTLLMNPIKDRIRESLQISQATPHQESVMQDSVMEHNDKLSERELADIVLEKLSYQDAELPPEQLDAMARDAEGRESAKKYARHLNALPAEVVSQVLPMLKERMVHTLDELGIPCSPFGRSDSWVYWDLGKQEYYFRQNNGKETVKGDRYSYSSTLEKTKLNEIIDRHVGWEFYHASAEAREKAFKSIDDPYYLARVFEVIQNDPKADGQLPSYEYAELGKILREYIDSK